MGGTRSQPLPAPDEAGGLRRDLSEHKAELDRVRRELLQAKGYLSNCEGRLNEHVRQAEATGRVLSEARKDLERCADEKGQARVALEKCNADRAADTAAAVHKCASDAAEFQARLVQMERGLMVASGIRASQTPVFLMVDDRVACASGPGPVILVPTVQGSMPDNALRILPQFDPRVFGADGGRFALAVNAVSAAVDWQQGWFLTTNGQLRLSVSVGHRTKNKTQSWRFAVPNPSASIFERRVEVQLLSDAKANPDTEPDPDPICILVSQPNTEWLSVVRRIDIRDQVTSFSLWSGPI